MPSSLPAAADRAHLLNSAPAPRMAKVHTAAHGNSVSWALMAECLNEVRGTLTVEQFAAAIDRDARQVGKWLSASERPQFETVFAVERFQQPLWLALGRRIKTVEITTQLTVRTA